MLDMVVPITASQFGRALVMPNTVPPILTGAEAMKYSRQITEALKAGQKFTPLMTIMLTMNTTPDMIREAASLGVIAAKLYPEGVTTNSSNGVNLDQLDRLAPVFDTMQQVGMVLCLHGEVPGLFVMVREAEFLKHVQFLAFHFTKLKIVLEHITTSDAVHLVLESPDNVAATITLHHLLLTLDDVLCFRTPAGEFLAPHNYCKPVAKTPMDRQTLILAATSGKPKFFFGSDTAPHPQGKKEAGCCAAGVWSAPVALPRLAQFFDEQGELARLRPFVSEFGAKFYGLPVSADTITLRKESWTVPASLAFEADGHVVPYLAGTEVTWSIVP